MALWMEAGSEPKTESEIADLEAITALKESAALELKEKGNQYVKMGKKHYSDAIDCYSRAINQKVLSNAENSIFFANRAHVNLLLGNYRRALTDAEEAIKLSPTNVKAFYRAARASLSLNLLAEAKSYCQSGLEVDQNNEELKKLVSQIDLKKSESDHREAQVSCAVAAAKDLVATFESRGLRIGKAMFRELIGVRKPILDKNSILHWPVLLLYAEAMSSDFIEDFCETDMFSAHLDMISFFHLSAQISFFSPPLPWDRDKAYSRDAIELYYEVGSQSCLSRQQIIRHLLEGTAGSHVENFDGEKKDEKEHSEYGVSGGGMGQSEWVKVNEKRTLSDILKEPTFVIPGIPVFYVVSKKSSFYKEFKAGRWALPL
ncbi:hypothetical protein RJ641_031218 [Dillenia turbinata]|uniref:Cns1/TTC4 wheel domain-containing protein n=1 Tax=Dillenia turbinata TaxID=194707 RepID=A0AAN8ZKR2_9MAGN